MIDFFLNLIKVNESVDYAMLISILVSYFFIIWFVICIWVFNDARKRYIKFITSFLFTLFVLLFGPPALIFYILVRPEHTLEEDYLINLALSGEREMKPIYFDGDSGFDISINLSVQPKNSADDKHKLNMSIDWMPQKKGLENVVINEGRSSGKKSGITQSFKTALQHLAEKVRGVQKQVSTSMKKRIEEKGGLEKGVQSEETSDTDIKEVRKENTPKQKKKKKKKKRRN